VTFDVVRLLQAFSNAMQFLV